MYERTIAACRRVTYTGAATACTAPIANAAAPMPIANGLTLSEILGIIGAVVAVTGLLAGQFWAWRKDQREAAENRARLRRLAHETIPAALAPCANDTPEQERRA